MIDRHDSTERGIGIADRPAFVLLEDGEWFAGTMAADAAPAFGEVVFTTNLTGYQETFTDPSYLGQIVVMTAPMIGNYGVTDQDMESARPQVSGVVVRELSRVHSNWRAATGLDTWLADSGIPVIQGVDTRRRPRCRQLAQWPWWPGPDRSSQAAGPVSPAGRRMGPRLRQ